MQISLNSIVFSNFGSENISSENNRSGIWSADFKETEENKLNEVIECILGKQTILIVNSANLAADFSPECTIDPKKLRDIILYIEYKIAV